MSLLARLFQLIQDLLRLGGGPPREPTPSPPDEPSPARPEPPGATAPPLDENPVEPPPASPETGPRPPADGVQVRGRRWTLMVYMAGDNGLRFPTETGWTQILAEMTSAGYTDITELRTAGSTDRVQALVQFDTVSEQDRSYRIVIQRRGEPPTVHTIPETNTGDPDTLRDFIVWGQQNYPADHYLVVLWNHGGGWKEEDIYAGVRSLGARGRRPALFRATVRRLVNEVRSASPEVQRRWIAADDTSKDFLDNAELAQAFREAEALTGQPVDIIGMDACLMAMASVAYQLRRAANYLVASEEVEPMPGWQYTLILNELNNRPDRTPRELAQLLVELYGYSYAESGQTITQSALALGMMEPLAQRLRTFVDTVDAHGGEPMVGRALLQAATYALAFNDPDYRDLQDFLEQAQQALQTLRDQARSPQAMDAVAEAVGRVLAQLTTPGLSPIVANVAQGRRFQDPVTDHVRAHGLAIYLPPRGRPMSPAYDRLDFRVSRWPDLVRMLTEA